LSLQSHWGHTTEQQDQQGGAEHTDHHRGK
jgi:hypothetical protein